MKIVRETILFLVVMITCGCGLKPLDMGAEDQDPFYVLSVTPQQGSLWNYVSNVELVFSSDVLEESLNSESIFVIKSLDFEHYDLSDWDMLQNDVLKSEIVSYAGDLELSEDKKVVALHLYSKLPDDDYVVVVLPQIQSTEFISLDQSSLGSSVSAFSSHFSVINSSDSELESISVTYPEPPPSEGEEIIDEPFDWNRVLITEVVTDPQQDHGDSAGGGIPFDPYPGTGTVGSSDEYIEIYNGTTDHLDMSFWTLNMMDGTDEVQELSDDSLEVYFSLEGAIDNVSPGEFVVLGNPVGALNNSVSIELVDDVGELVDSVDIDDANATGLEDEAYYRTPTGEWEQGFASPGGFLDL